MSLSETDWRYFASSYEEKMVSIREAHERKRGELESYGLHPMKFGSTKHLMEVQPMERLNMLIEEIKHYAKESVTAFIDAFIDVHESIDLHPDDRDVETFLQRLYPIPERCIGSVEEYYKSIYSPIPSKVVVDRIFDLLHQELGEYPSLFSPKLNKFLAHSARRKERNLPLNSPAQNITNTLNVSGDLNGSAQVGTNRSSQNVAEIQLTIQNELSGQEQKEHIPVPIDDPIKVKIAERRKNRTLLGVEVYRAANGCRGRRVYLWDLAKKLGIAEDEAKEVRAYYQEQYYFEKDSGGLVSLSHDGIVGIERDILDSKDHPDLILDIQKRQELRLSLLKKLFDKTGGSTQEKVNLYDIAKSEGVSEDDISCFLHYLTEKGFIKYVGGYAWYYITDPGIDAVIEWMDAQKNEMQTGQIDQQFEIVLSRKLKVFLCHSSKNKPVVRELYNRLSADGIEPWLDEKNILPGQDWELEIKRAVRNSDAIIVCLSKDAMNNRGYVHKEIKLVLDEADRQPEGHIFIIPILLEECEVPERLNHLHYLRDYDNPDAYGTLLRSLKARAEQIERPEGNKPLSEKQSHLYDDLWISLCDLRIAADDLWESPNVANAEKVATHLKKTEVQVMKGSIYIDDQHIESLKRLIKEFNDFRIGKVRLIALMDGQSSQKYGVRDTEIQVATQMNREIRHRYLRLLEEIENSFRKQVKG